MAKCSATKTPPTVGRAPLPCAVRVTQCVVLGVGVACLAAAEGWRACCSCPFPACWREWAAQASRCHRREAQLPHH
eukprot:4709949-Pleurochrysis_carterae.AAC.1